MSFDPVINVENAPDETTDSAPPWSSTWRVLTPHMRDAGGSLGVVYNCVPPGNVAGPFHWHMHEDEVFYILSGEGTLRYGEETRVVVPGDCISCPAGRQTGHQLANRHPTQDLVYLAIGPHIGHEVCGYPDSGKVYVRGIQTIGRLEATGYMDGEPETPYILGDS